MNTITDIRKIPDFNQQKYDELIQQAKTVSVAAGLVESSLLEAVNSGKDFDEAMRLIKSNLPRLASPNVALMANLANWPALPAPGAVIMALITEFSAEQRQQNRETVWAQTEAVVDSMKEQAGKMRSMAVHQLVIGLAGAALKVAGGVRQATMASGADGGTNTLSVKAQGVGMAFTGGSDLLGAAGQIVGTMFSAQFKEMEADQEKMRAMRDSLKDLNDGLKELIQKTLSSAESIQQGKNQATTRILA